MASTFSRMFLVALGLVLLGLPSSSRAAPREPPAEQIAGWIRDLGSEDFSARENASQQLWLAGRSAEPALKRAAQSRDAEVARRASELLEKFRWGIYPDTPAKVIALIARYQAGAEEERRKVITELLALGGPGCVSLLRIAEAEKDAHFRQVIFNRIGQEASRAIPALLVDGRFDVLEELLDLSARSKEGPASAGAAHACYWLLRGKIDDRIAALEKETRASPNPRLDLILAYLHRARGNLPAALTAAEKSGESTLVEAILFEQGAWATLAERVSVNGAERPAEALGFRAAYLRLAGNKEELVRTLAEIRKRGQQSKESDFELWLSAKALLLNDRPDDALELLAESPRYAPRAAEILIAQMKFGEVQALAKKWQGGTFAEKPLLDVVHAGALFSLGEREKAQAIFEALARDIRADNETEWEEKLLDTEYRVGLRDEARAHCARILTFDRSPERHATLLNRVFPGSGETALAWWEALRRRHPSEGHAASMKRLTHILEGTMSEKDLAALAREAEGTVRDRKPSDHEALFLAVADTARTAQHDDLYRTYLRKAVDVRESPVPLIRLGDDHAARNQWQDAARRYTQAWEGHRSDALPLFLRGHALMKSGQEAEGKQWMERAHFLPLGDEPARYAFANALEERGHADAAYYERTLLLKTSAPGSFYAGEALRQVANTAHERKEFLKAADLHARAMTRALDARISFMDNTAYVRVPHFVHRHQAEALVAAGREEEAKQVIALCQGALPGDVELPIALVPVMEQKGHKEQADRLYQTCFTHHQRLVRDYPRSAWAHNSLAWLAACCRRDLDTAQTHAREAVKLDPDNAGYHDTLSEVHFQRGEQEKALIAAQRSLQLAPRSLYFRRQLERIKAGDPRAPLPPETE